MKTILRISLCLNLILFGGVFIMTAKRRNEAAVPAPVSAEVPTAQQAAASPVTPASPEKEPEPFSWRQLESTKSYRLYIANLRAIGCPEPTIQDIVRGDTERAFALERRQLGLDGTGNGPWTQSRETQLVASLMGGQQPAAQAAAPAQSAENSPGSSQEAAGTADPEQNMKTAAPSYPLFLQNVNWSALGFDASQQDAIAQVRQQFQSAVNGLNQSPNAPAGQNTTASTSNSGGSTSSTGSSPGQTALQSPNQQLEELLGAQGYAAYEQQQYYSWYQPQVMANEGGGTLNIDPEAFSQQQ